MKTFCISLLSQKGGVGKSVVACLIATEFHKKRKRVLLGDLDIRQYSAIDWAKFRLQNADLKEEIKVLPGRTLTSIKEHLNDQSFLIIDTPGHASKESLAIAKESDLVILPVQHTAAALLPQLRLGRLFVEKGVSPTKISFLFNMVSSPSEYEMAVQTIKEAGSKFYIFEQAIPFRSAYGKGGRTGCALSETPHATLNQVAKDLVVEIEILIKDKRL